MKVLLLSLTLILIVGCSGINVTFNDYEGRDELYSERLKDD